MVSQESTHTDLVVIGGGLAGCTAAIAAARLGKKVELITNRPVLGGNSSSEIRVWVVGATAHGVQRFARETGIMGELFLENQYRNPEGNPIYWDQVILDAVRAEERITLHLNTDIHELHTGEDGAITSVSGWSMLTETWHTFSAPYFIDATGDGLIGALAGAHYMLGRESCDEFAEEWAPREADNELLGSSLFFYSKDTGHPVRFVPPNHAINIRNTPILANRVIKTGDNGCAYWWIEWGGHLDIVKNSDRIRDELSGVVFGIWDYIKNSGELQAQNHTLEWVGQIPGRREYRRLRGDHVLTQEDVITQHSFDDAVAYGGWSIDLHPVEGMYSPNPGARQRYANGPYQIPLRCLYSRNIPNLLMAGRDISASHIAAGSSRVMATCATVGQAVGTAAALMIDTATSPREIASHPHHLQQVLLREDAPLMGVRADDPGNLLRNARVSASSWCRTVSTGSASTGSALEAACPDAGEITLERDLALSLPLDGAIDGIDTLIQADTAGSLSVEYWVPGRPQNYVPEHRIASHRLSFEAGQQWLRLPAFSAQEYAQGLVIQGQQSQGETEAGDGVGLNLIVILRSCKDLRLPLTTFAPYGLLLMQRKDESCVGFDERIPDEPGQLLTTWVARDLRGSYPIIRVDGTSRVYAPQRILDGWQRPYGGPHMWVSAPCAQDGDDRREEWIELDLPEPVDLASVRIIFNDDVDADLVNLHHHRTPWTVAPTLVSDYILQARSATATDAQASQPRWVSLAEVHDNRHRHAIHDFPTLRADRLRLRVLATAGAPYASIVAIKAYGEVSGRAASPWR